VIPFVRPAFGMSDFFALRRAADRDIAKRTEDAFLHYLGEPIMGFSQGRAEALCTSPIGPSVSRAKSLSHPLPAMSR